VVKKIAENFPKIKGVINEALEAKGASRASPPQSVPMPAIQPI